ncbi:MAG: lamin tail domain-containing protein [Tannerellaceae bacterium]|jgi:Na+-transporting methylmalonyl-CoA/oxaloacetate decarboxylase gamma subunit|nr:lamin tail domain-containing protein [Tannerellaceae bacterium]
MNRIRKKTGVLLLFALLLGLTGAQAQRSISMRINEVLVINEDNFVDDYGKRNSWIELYNTSAGTVNISGCFLTNDINNPKKYPIPKGDVLTRISPRQHVLFWADGMASRGTFHLNFTLDPEKENYIALFDSDGKTLIDGHIIPAGQTADISFGRKVDGQEQWGNLAKVTPSTNNLTLDTNEKIDNFKTNDSVGIGMTITAMAVVFIGLFILYFIFKQVAKLAIAVGKLRAEKAGHDTTVHGSQSGEVLAAISTALYELNEDVHDIERTVLTIQKVKRNYSPWSSKIYSLRENPRK